MKKDLKFEIYHNGDFFCARCFDLDIFTQGKKLGDLYYNIKEASNLYFEEPEIAIKKNDYNGIFAMMEFSF